MPQTVISNPPDILMQHYVDLLEKTNQQLNLWSNPYGVLVAILSTLFTVLTVVAAFIIWKQSKEQKEAFKEALKNYETGLEESLKKIGIDAGEKIQSFIEIKTTEINTLSGDTKKKAEKILNDLKNEKESIGSRIQFSSMRNNPIAFGNGSSVTAGGWGGSGGWSGYSGWGGSGVGLTSSYCPNCGAPVNISELNISPSSISFCRNCGKAL